MIVEIFVHPRPKCWVCIVCAPRFLCWSQELAISCLWAHHLFFSKPLSFQRYLIHWKYTKIWHMTERYITNKLHYGLSLLVAYSMRILISFSFCFNFFSTVSNPMIYNSNYCVISHIYISKTKVFVLSLINQLKTTTTGQRVFLFSVVVKTRVARESYGKRKV